VALAVLLAVASSSSPSMNTNRPRQTGRGAVAVVLEEEEEEEKELVLVLGTASEEPIQTYVHRAFESNTSSAPHPTQVTSNKQKNQTITMDKMEEVGIGHATSTHSTYYDTGGSVFPDVP